MSEPPLQRQEWAPSLPSRRTLARSLTPPRLPISPPPPVQASARPQVGLPPQHTPPLQGPLADEYPRDVKETNHSVASCVGASDALTASTLPLLPKYDYKHEESSDEKVLVLKAKLYSRDDCITWVQEFEKLNKTKWIVQHSNGESQRIVCRKQYVCHHSSHGKKNSSRKSKNLNCSASLSIIIMKRAKDGYPAKITMKGEHSHSIHNAEVLATLPASENTRVSFEKYFNNGLGITEAINFHLNKLELECDEEELANGSINPKYRTVQNWYHKWREANLGPRAGKGVTEKLKEKQLEYEKMGTQIIIQEDPFTIVCMTSLMKRAHKFAGDIVFVDSTASCDAEHHTLTFMLTCTEAGAVPVAVIISKGQTKVEYEAAFKSVRDLVGKEGFGGNGFPKIFMTDDSDAERGALRNVFPESELLLCTFHVGQSIWRWLTAKEHNVSKNDRQHLYKLFQNILTASDITSAENCFLILQTDKVSRKYSNWIKYMGNYWNSRTTWCLAFRDATTHGNQTNNFSETTVRIYKDIVLARCKAYNAVSLVDFTCTVLEQYYVRRLRNYANGRVDKNRLIFANIAKKSAYLTSDQILQTNNYHYIVPSEEDKNKKYRVDLLLGSCSCNVGRLGKLCKHIIGVYSVVLKKTSIENRFAIAQLALGEKVSSKIFYEPMNNSYNNSNECISEEWLDMEVDENGEYTSEEWLDMEVDEEDSSFTTQQVNEEGTSEIGSHVPCDDIPSTSNSDIDPNGNWHDKLHNLLNSIMSTYKSSDIVAKRLIQRLQKVKSDVSLDTFLSTAGSQMQARHRRTTAIRVQPAAIARRRPGVTRGSKRLPSGRSAAGEPPRKKRPHNLSLNIKNNVANAKLH